MTWSDVFSHRSVCSVMVGCGAEKGWASGWRALLQSREGGLNEAGGQHTRWVQVELAGLANGIGYGNRIRAAGSLSRSDQWIVAP